MRTLKDEDIIQMMREEWDAKVARLSEAVKAVTKGKVDGRESDLISVDLKVRHKKTQFLYTVKSVSPNDVVLRTPEGKDFIVDNDELTQNYEIDLHAGEHTMKQNSQRGLLSDVDVESIIRKSLKNTVPETTKLDESYVAEPKQFKQVTEFVSQKTKDAHTALYKGYVDSLNRVSAELDTAERSKVDSRHCDFRSLKLDEAYNLNAVWLHELYFANCFDPHSEIVMDSLSYLRVQRDWGTFDDWQRDFMACAMSCGNGWAVLGYHTYLRKYTNFIVSHHSGDVPLGVYPVLVIDCWEHAYVKDYSTDKKSFVVSQMREINWSVVEDRVKKSESIAQVVKLWTVEEYSVT